MGQKLPVPKSLRQLIERRAQDRPDSLAILSPGREPLSNDGLLSQVEEVSDVLRRAGLGPEDRVAMSLENGPEMAVAFLGVSAVAACAPLNPAYREEECDFFLQDLQARALIAAKGDGSPARRAARRRGIPVFELSSDAGERAGTFRLAAEGDGAGAARLSGPDDVALLLHTSGTTSRPKLVPLTHANLCASAENVRRALDLGPSDRCLNVMPLFHVHGLVGALLSSLAGGGSVVCAPGFHAPRFFEWMEECEPTWYTAVPTMHQAILARADAHQKTIARRPLRFIRSSSAALPPRVMAELESVFGAPVIESYGMTEASHQMASNPVPPRSRKPGSVGVAAGPEIAIRAESGELLGRGQTGEIVVRGPSVTKGYIANPTANAQAFAAGWLRTGDQGYLDPDGYVHLTGRLKEMVNRGGEKISPREVDEVLLEHPAVASAVAFGFPHPKLGEDLAAAVVLREPRAASEGELRDFAADRLAAFKVPGRILIVDEIPKGATGKLQRIGLAEKLGVFAEAPAPPPAERVAPRTAREESLAAIWREVLRVAEIGIHDDFFAVGGDSVLATQILARVEERFGVQVSLVTLFEAKTIAALASILEP